MPLALRIFATIAALLVVPIIVTGVLASNKVENANGICNLLILALLLDAMACAIWMIWTTP